MALNRLTNITSSGLGSVHSYEVTGVVAVGVITASSFSGNITGDIVGDVTGNADTATTATTLADAANITTGTISNDRLPATITKNLTGNVTGNTSGTAGGLTGSPSIIVTDITATGNVSIGGTLTYEDVTNIDSVGIITARDGIIVTGGLVGIGTDNPGQELEIFSNAFAALRVKSSRTGLTDQIGGIGFSTTSDQVATINALVDGTVLLKNTTNDTERLRVDSTGLVGIGTNIPQTITHIFGTNPILRIQDNSAPIADAFAAIQLGESNSGGAIQNYWQFALEGDSGTSTDHFTIKDGTGERLRITSAGNIGIGLTDPDLKLHVSGTNGLPATSGSTPTGHISVRAKSSGSSHGFHMGVSNAAPWSSWIQAQDANNLATEYPLLLNPNGGNVGVGTDNPVVKLDIVDSGSPNIALRGSSYPSIRYSALDGTTDAEIYYGISGNDLVLNNVNAGPTILKTDNVERLRITSNVGPWAEGNKGTTPGTLHLKPGSTDHMGGAITFGASDDTASGSAAMAGIYTRTNGTYGTKMYLATTDSYATGPKNFLEADMYGHIRTPRQPFIYGRPTNTTGSGIFNAMGSTQTRGGLAFTSDRITVAREGVYLITFNTICDTGTGRADARIRVNGNTIVNTLSENNGTGYHYRSASICYYLNANDYIQVENEDWYSAASSTVDWKTLSVALLG